MQNSTKAWWLASLTSLGGCLASGEEVSGESADKELGARSAELSENAVRTRVVGSNTDWGDEWAGDNFGAALALSDDGLTLVVSAPGEASGSATDPDDNEAPYAGAVYVFTRPARDADWVQEAYLKASNLESQDEFGEAVAISGDGKYLAVGCPEEEGNGTSPSDNSMPDAGAVYVFRHDVDTGSWVEEAYVKASYPREDNRFGTSVALSTDGSTLAVGALHEGEDRGQLFEPGAAYVFRRGSFGWTEQAILKASNGDDLDMFGARVALDGSGNLLAVSAPCEESAANGVDGNGDQNIYDFNAGAVYTFKFEPTGDGSDVAWNQQSYIKASNNSRRDAYGNRFGGSLALSSDGSTLAVGAADEDSAARLINGNQKNDAARDSGATYVFRATANGSWAQEAYVKPNNTDEGDHFGNAVALTSDGNYLVVGAYDEGSNATEAVGGDPFNNRHPGRGAAYVFARTGTQWAQQAYLKPERDQGPNALPPTGFGGVVDIDAVGDVIAATTTRYSRQTAGIFTFTDL